MSHSVPRRPRRSKNDEQPARSTVLLRLVTALVLFGVCFVAKVHFPRQTQSWRTQLCSLIGAQTDLKQSFSRLGEELEQREAVVRAVGDWCVSVFGPEGLEVPARGAADGPEASGVPEQAAGPGEAAVPETSEAKSSPGGL